MCPTGKPKSLIHNICAFHKQLNVGIHVCLIYHKYILISSSPNNVEGHLLGTTAIKTIFTEIEKEGDWKAQFISECFYLVLCKELTSHFERRINIESV